jgi:hypothetical protein
MRLSCQYDVCIDFLSRLIKFSVLEYSRQFWPNLLYRRQLLITIDDKKMAGSVAILAVPSDLAITECIDLEVEHRHAQVTFSKRSIICILSSLVNLLGNRIPTKIQCY